MYVHRARHMHLSWPMARAWIGTSGWVYKGWREHLYADAPVRRWLEIASRTFSALEINGSFYTQIKRETYERWHRETPDDFRFALKGHRFVTHYKRLRDCRDSVILLRDQAKGLGDKLAAVVWQLPSTFGIDTERLDDFLHALTAWPDVRHALELRHRSWFVPEVADRMRAAGVSVCMSDAPDFPLWHEVTSDLVYVRLHGHTRKYASSYSRPLLEKWAADAKRWIAEGRDVHVYFDNDALGHAVRDAQRFTALVDGSPLPARRVAGHSELAISGSSRGEPWRRRTSPSTARAPNARRSTARTSARGRRPSAR
jgi:uncharacterized protein YecE (DUF72 family)